MYIFVILKTGIKTLNEKIKKSPDERHKQTKRALWNLIDMLRLSQMSLSIRRK
jgi:hypothetical protein